MEIYGLSDKGLKRENNEDSFLVSKKRRYAIVADGMGGYLGGEVASSMCTKRLSDLIDNMAEPPSDINALKGFLENAVEKINDEIYQRSIADSNLHGMGTTVSFLIEYDMKILYLNIGDSRIYYVRNDKLVQLSKDDSVVGELFYNGEISKDEMRIHPLRHIITKALGTTTSVSFNAQVTDYLKNDYFILCSDGLNDMLEDTEILELILKQKKPKRICQKLIKLANEHGGRDNITVVVCKF
jgi:serine/threonine protein phosphatase PrpC